jgi:hypothetical protein
MRIATLSAKDAAALVCCPAVDRYTQLSAKPCLCVTQLQEDEAERVIQRGAELASDEEDDLKGVEFEDVVKGDRAARLKRFQMKKLQQRELRLELGICRLISV